MKGSNILWRILGTSVIVTTASGCDEDTANDMIRTTCASPKHVVVLVVLVVVVFVAVG